MNTTGGAVAMQMPVETTEIRIKGRNIAAPTLRVADRHIVVSGGWLKTAAVHDESFVVEDIAPDPERIMAGLKEWEVRPDLFTFSQKINDPTPRHAYKLWWDNFAVIPITTYEDWLKKIKKDVKENLRRAKREGVVARIVEYDDQFVAGIKELCDESPYRQGMRFWHYGKSFEEIKKVHGTYRERAQYIGAYLGDELIGFIKFVYVGEIAKTMHVISKERYFNKRPTNALLAKAVEVCAQKGVKYFIYGEFKYLGKSKSTLSDFKRRNGFEEFRYPRYFVPLTWKGKLALATGLHLGVRNIIPKPVLALMLKVRSWVYAKLSPQSETVPAQGGAGASAAAETPKPESAQAPEQE